MVGHEANGSGPDEEARPPRARRFARSAAPRRMHLTERDQAVLEALARHRVLSGEQIRRLVLRCGGSRARRRLRMLFDHQYVSRVALTAQPALGIPPFVYELTADGATALAEAGWDGVRRSPLRGGLQLMRHTLLVNEALVAFSEAAIANGMSLRGWRDEAQLRLPTADGRGRAERIEHPLLDDAAPFLPDGYFELVVSPHRSLAFFLEVDLSTHPQGMWRHRSRLYTAYADPGPGLFWRRFGRRSFRLLVVCRDDYRGRSRANNVLHSLLDGGGASELFLVTTVANLQADRVFERVWWRPGETRPRSLFDTGPPRITVRPR